MRLNEEEEVAFDREEEEGREEVLRLRLDACSLAAIT